MMTVPYEDRRGSVLSMMTVFMNSWGASPGRVRFPHSCLNYASMFVRFLPTSGCCFSSRYRYTPVAKLETCSIEAITSCGRIDNRTCSAFILGKCFLFLLRINSNFHSPVPREHNSPIPRVILFRDLLVERNLGSFSSVPIIHLSIYLTRADNPN